MSIPSSLQQYHFHVILIWWHSPFNLELYWISFKKIPGTDHFACLTYTFGPYLILLYYYTDADSNIASN
jgi:hypothetical protein